jgi:hypothetical protein
MEQKKAFELMPIPSFMTTLVRRLKRMEMSSYPGRTFPLQPISCFFVSIRRKPLSQVLLRPALGVTKSVRKKCTITFKPEMVGLKAQN